MKLFVYGTLAPGKPNEHVLKDLKGTWMPARVKGERFESGWGAAMGFPGLVLDANGDDVEGLVFCSKELEAHWQRLDDFEGEGYQRELTSVLLETGETVEAYVYTLTDISQR